MNKKRASKAKNSLNKKWRIRLMSSAIIKKASKDEQQNQSTTNINYIKNFMSISKKKLITKSKWRQIKLQLNKITFTSLEKKRYGTSP